MKRFLRLVVMAVAPTLALGCQSMGILVDPPSIMSSGSSSSHDENPVYIPLAPKEYGRVFESILQTLGDYGFEVGAGDSNRYDGRIEALPRVSPGFLLFLKPGSPDLSFRLLSTTQSYRHRVTVLIQPANEGGFFVEFIARKELEDLPRPIRASTGSAAFRSENTAERQTEVIDATFFQSNWIYKGRDTGLEHELIQRFKKAQGRPICTTLTDAAIAGPPCAGSLHRPEAMPLP